MLCPTCHHPLDAKLLHVDLETNIAVRGERWVKITRQQAEILSIIEDAAPRTLGFDAILIRLCGWRDHPEHGENLIRVQIARMRKKIETLGVTILSVYGKGYRLQEIEPAEVAA